jgi:fluoride ion exporter CrcB/FEX
MNEHTRERNEDKAERKVVSEVKASDMISVKKLAGVGFLLIMSIIGWNLIQVYNLNAQVAVHTEILTNLQTDMSTMQPEVQSMYQSRNWNSALLNNSMSDATPLR